ncbi:hypothetical protein KJ652_05925 [Patescibacteria group bacterium]|nr:hypothetical protein [Patescibacteria group bacterium]MBU1124099.1 hypothetical protein [Patescibacteria group bacterium]MBU1911823.1 hypothetical protein [Patescibacteria group bacterium]
MSFSGAPQCCDGLNTIIIASKVNGECTAPSSLPGLNVSICSNCGDGTCEAWENECNCITDCPSSPPTDDDPLDPACGDGVITPSTGEVCDDKNTDVFDGCDDKCKKEIGWKCEGEPSVCEMLIPSAGTQTQEPINVTPKMRE